MDEIEQDTRGFMPLVVFAEFCGAVAVILTGVWMGHYRGGFAWQSDPAHEFNWHPLLMIFSLVYAYGNGILFYRIFRNERKKKLKVAHAIIMISAFFLAVIGLKAVFDSHNLANVPNLYTLHSWIGLVTVILFSLQWVAGCVTFLFPGLASHLRISFMPVHIFFGMLIFTMACATALLGIAEKTIFALGSKYQQRDPEGVMANWIGILIVLFGITVVYLVGNPAYKRLTRPEDEMLLQENATSE